MKKGLLFLLTLVLIGTFAATASAQTDPCATATFIIDVVNIVQADLLSTVDNLTTIASYDLQSGGATVGHGISKYTSQSFGATSYVASEETVILDALSLTVFGQSSNTVDSIAGATGVITGAVQFDGVKRNDIQGTYLFSDFLGTLEICVFLGP